MNHHYADIVHRSKMATYYAEAEGSRLAAESGRVGLRERIRGVLALIRRPEAAEQESVRGHISERPSLTKVS